MLLRMKTAKPTGRPHALGPAQLDMLGRLREAHPLLSIRQLTVRLEAACSVRVSHATVGLELKRMGYTHTRKAIRTVSPPDPDCPRIPRRYTKQPRLNPPAPSFRKAYPTDMTDSEWTILAPLIPAPLPGGRPAHLPRRELVNAMFYVLRNGCTWRALPHDFPVYSTVYDYFRQWRNAGVWQTINDALREMVRVKAGRDPTPSAASLDSQSVKTTEKRGIVAMTVASASPAANGIYS